MDGHMDAACAQSSLALRARSQPMTPPLILVSLEINLILDVGFEMINGQAQI